MSFCDMNTYLQTSSPLFATNFYIFVEEKKAAFLERTHTDRFAQYNNKEGLFARFHCRSPRAKVFVLPMYV